MRLRRCRKHREDTGAELMVPQPRSEVADALAKVENLEARADRVHAVVTGRQATNHWGETVAAIVRGGPVRHVTGEH